MKALSKFQGWLGCRLLAVVLVLGLPGLAQADSIYVRVEGARQGLISAGASVAKGHEDEITLFGFGHSIVIPRDVQSGLPTGQRQHQPLRIYKTFDKASPLLYQALVTGERLTKVELRFWRTGPDGRPEHYFTILLVDAILVDITAAAGSEDGSTREVLGFTYRRIEWTNEVDGTTSSDDWAAPAA